MITRINASDFKAKFQCDAMTGVEHAMNILCTLCDARKKSVRYRKKGFFRLWFQFSIEFNILLGTIKSTALMSFNPISFVIRSMNNAKNLYTLNAAAYHWFQVFLCVALLYSLMKHPIHGKSSLLSFIFIFVS